MAATPPPRLRALRALGPALTLALSGCMVGPDFSPPSHDTPTPARYYAPTNPLAPGWSATTPDHDNLTLWWARFNDPVLTELVQKSLVGNLTLAQAQARIRQARAARGVVAADLWPMLDANGFYRRSYAGFPHRTPKPSSGGSNLWQGSLDAVWEIDVFGGTRRGIEAADADIQTAIEDKRDVLVSLVAEVALDYIDLRGFQQQITIAQENLEAQLKSLDLTRRRFEGGFVSGLDVANAQAQVATTRSTIPQLQAAAAQMINALSVLLGQDPGYLAQRLADAAAIPSVPPVVPVGVPSELLRRRPDIRRAESQAHAATARIGVATADLFPRFALTGSLGLDSNKLANVASLSNRFWSVGPAVSWPIFNAGQIRSNIEVQNALTEQAVLFYKQTVLNALQETEDALVAYTREQQHLKDLQEAVAANQRAVQISMQLYTQGQTDFLNVLEAQRSLFASQAALISSQAAVGTNLVAIYKALGGGWDIPQGEDTAPPKNPPPKS